MNVCDICGKSTTKGKGLGFQGIVTLRANVFTPEHFVNDKFYRVGHSEKWLCSECLNENSSQRINVINGHLNNLGIDLRREIDSTRDTINKKDAEVKDLIQSLSLRIDENTALFESKSEELDQTISDFTEGAERFNQAKLETLLTEKETELNLEITKKDNLILKQKEEIAELKLKLNKLELSEVKTELRVEMEDLRKLVKSFVKITGSNEIEINNLHEENNNLRQLLESKFKDEKQYELIEKN